LDRNEEHDAVLGRRTKSGRVAADPTGVNGNQNARLDGARVRVIVVEATESEKGNQNAPLDGARVRVIVVEATESEKGGLKGAHHTCMSH